MTDAAPAIFVALEASSLGAAIRQSTWVYMAANVGHIVSLVVFAGAVAVMDVRMTGALAATSPGYVLKMARRFVVTGFIGLFKSLGLATATVQAPHVSHAELNGLFWLNVAFGAAALLVAIAVAPLLAIVYAEPAIGTMAANSA